MVALGGRAVSYERGTPVGFRVPRRSRPDPGEYCNSASDSYLRDHVVRCLLHVPVFTTQSSVYYTIRCLPHFPVVKIIARLRFTTAGMIPMCSNCRINNPAKVFHTPDQDPDFLMIAIYKFIKCCNRLDIVVNFIFVY